MGDLLDAQKKEECVANVSFVSVIGVALCVFWSLLAIVFLLLDAIVFAGKHSLAVGTIVLATAAVLALTCAFATAAFAFLPCRNPWKVIKGAATSFQSAWRRETAVS